MSCRDMCLCPQLWASKSKKDAFAELAVWNPKLRILLPKLLMKFIQGLIQEWFLPFHFYSSLQYPFSQLWLGCSHLVLGTVWFLHLLLCWYCSFASSKWRIVTEGLLTFFHYFSFFMLKIQILIVPFWVVCTFWGFFLLLALKAVVGLCLSGRSDILLSTLQLVHYGIIRSF